jgi:hypothetical protein
MGAARGINLGFLLVCCLGQICGTIEYPSKSFDFPLYLTFLVG